MELGHNLTTAYYSKHKMYSNVRQKAYKQTREEKYLLFKRYKTKLIDVINYIDNEHCKNKI